MTRRERRVADQLTNNKPRAITGPCRPGALPGVEIEQPPLSLLG